MKSKFAALLALVASAIPFAIPAAASAHGMYMPTWIGRSAIQTYAHRVAAGVPSVHGTRIYACRHYGQDVGCYIEYDGSVTCTQPAIAYYLTGYSRPQIMAKSKYLHCG